MDEWTMIIKDSAKNGKQLNFSGNRNQCKVVSYSIFLDKETPRIPPQGKAEEPQSYDIFQRK